MQLQPLALLPRPLTARVVTPFKAQPPVVAPLVGQPLGWPLLVLYADLNNMRALDYSISTPSRAYSFTFNDKVKGVMRYFIATGNVQYPYTRLQCTLQNFSITDGTNVLVDATQITAVGNGTNDPYTTFVLDFGSVASPSLKNALKATTDDSLDLFMEASVAMSYTGTTENITIFQEDCIVYKSGLFPLP